MNESILSKIISGTSSILDTANKIIPLYNDIKPLMQNIINIKNKLKKFNIASILNNTNSINKNEPIKKEEVINTSSIPQFFQ